MQPTKNTSSCNQAKHERNKHLQRFRGVDPDEHSQIARLKQSIHSGTVVGMCFGHFYSGLEELDRLEHKLKEDGALMLLCTYCCTKFTCTSVSIYEHLSQQCWRQCLNICLNSAGVNVCLTSVVSISEHLSQQCWRQCLNICLTSVVSISEHLSQWRQCLNACLSSAGVNTCLTSVVSISEYLSQ
jgi:hypothetical protein